MFKKGKFFLTALMLCGCGVLTLTACGNTNSSSQGSSSSQTGEFIPGLSVSEFNGIAVVGDVIDLDQYIKYDGGNNYDAELVNASKDLAVLDGHKLTVKKEGTISVKVSKGDENGRFTFDAVSQLKKQFDEDLKTADKKFFLDEIEMSQTGMVTTGNGLVHNDNYFALYTGTIENGQYTSRYYEGLLKTKSTNTYWFNMDNLNGDNFVVKPGKQSQFELYYAAASLNTYLATSSFKTVTETDETTGNTVEYLSCTDVTAITEFHQYYLLMYSATAMKDRLAAGGVNLISEELVLTLDEYTLEDNTTQKFWTVMDLITYQNAEDGKTYVEPWSANLIDLREESCSVKVVDDYLESGAEPEALKCDEMFTKINEIATAKNYTLTVDSYFHNNVEKVTAPSGSEGVLPELSVSSKVTEDAIYNVETETGICDGYMTVEGKQYSFTNLDENGAKTETVTVKADDTAKTKFTTIDIINDSTLMNGANITVNEEQDGVHYIASSLEGVTSFGLNAMKLVPLYGESLAKAYAQNFNENMLFIEIFDLNCEISSDKLVLSFGAVWSDGIYYSLDLVFTDIGTTSVVDVLPALPQA